MNISPTRIFNGKPSRTGTFADLLVRYVRERRGGDAPAVYGEARLNRRTWSAIVSNPFRPVSKRTAIQFAFALHLSLGEAEGLLRSAGYAFSPAIPEDVCFAEFIENGMYDLFKVNARLYDLGLKVIA